MFALAIASVVLAGLSTLGTLSLWVRWTVEETTIREELKGLENHVKDAASSFVDSVTTKFQKAHALAERTFALLDTSPMPEAESCGFCGRHTGDVGQFFSGGKRENPLHICNFCVNDAIAQMDRTDIERPCFRCALPTSTWMMVDGERIQTCRRCWSDWRASPVYASVRNLIRDFKQHWPLEAGANGENGKAEVKAAPPPPAPTS